MYENDEEKRKREMYERVMQAEQEKQQRKQEMYNRVINNEPTPTTTTKSSTTQNAPFFAPVTSKLKQKMQQMAEDKRNFMSNTTMNRVTQNTTQNTKTQPVGKIDMSNLTTEQKKKLEEIQKQTNRNKVQSLSEALVNTGKVNKEQADRIVQQKLEADKEANLTNLAKNLSNTTIGKSSGGKVLTGFIETVDNAPQIIDSAMRGADTGSAQFVEYLNRLKDKKNETYDKMGTFGKVLAAVRSDSGYFTDKAMSKILGQDTIEENKSDFYNKVKEFKQENNNRIAENQSIVKANSTTKMAPKLNELAPSIGNNATGAAISAVNPVLGTTYFIGSAAGSYYDDGIQRGMNEDQALRYGAIAGTLEGVTEKFAVGESVKAGMLLGKGKLKQALIKTGINIGENFLQEAVMEPLQETSAMIVGGKDKADFSNMWNRMLKSGVDGALSAILMEGATSGVSSAQNVQTRIENGENVSVGEIQQAFKDIQESGKVDIEKEIKSSINYEIQKVNEQQTTQRQDSLKGKSFEDIVDEAMSNYQYEEVKSPLQDRDIKTIGKEKVNAYQYDNPEVKPYFQEMAQMLGEDIGNVASKDNRSTIKGGGTSLNTNIAAVKQLHEMGYSYNQIADGLTDIIEDNGKENNAISKKLEIIIDDQLRNGYINSYGKYVSPNEEYINLINKNTNNPSLNQQQQISQTENKNGLNQNVEEQKKLEQRISGDELLNTQDFIDEIKNVGANIDENGYVTLYHRTSKENADNIYKSGKMSAKEDGIFFSTSKDGYNNSNYGESVVEFKVPAELLELDDIFEDEASVKIKLDNKNQQLDVRGYLLEKDNINDFNGYTQKEINNIKSDKISIAQSSEDISKFVNNSKKFPGNFKMYLGKIKENTSNLIKNKLGINVDNYNISLKTDDVRKIFKDHGSEKTEIPRGQVPITEKDFLNIPDIINNPDLISLEGKSPQGKPAIKFEKNIDGNTVVVTYVSDKHNNLEMQTMYKFKNNKKRDSATALHENQTPGLNTSEMDSGTNLFINNIIPQNNQNVNNQDSTNLLQVKNVSQNNDINLPPSISANNKYKDTTTKVRKHYKSIIESQYTSDEARAIAKELMGLDTYIPETNKSELERADNRISIAGPESELNSLMSRASTGEKITPVDIAVGERLIQYYSKTGNKAKLRDAIQATAMAGTTAGQTVQAMSLLNHQTPEGQAIWLQRSVEKMNNDLKKSRGPKAEQFTLTDDMLNKIVNSESTEELHKNLDEVYKELGQQVTKSTIQKVDAWRYFSMLANPRTHIRNIVGNTAMAGMQYGIKNKVAGAVEGVVSKFNKDMERTHTIVPASKEVKAFAKADIKNVSDRLGLTDNKYNPKSRLENNMRTFKHKALENTVGKAFKFNDYMLEAEDGWGLKGGYAKSLAEYMTANKLTPSTITDAQLAKARNYAIDQAKQATFHQENQLATLINQLANKNKFAKFTVDAILPFKKTPMNIAKQGIEYSPVGLAKSMVYDSVQLRKGNITVNQYIDNVSKGLTGTGIALVGYALASMGILKASGGDDDKDKYDEARGKQTYSIEIAGKTYSLDWLAPTGIPLFIGAEIFQLKQKSNDTSAASSDDEKKYNQAIKSAVNILDGFTNAMNPMTEMSMLSGLTSALSSYEQGSSKMLASMGTNATKSYVNQFVPTALGQIAKTTDKYERSTTSTKTGVLPKAVDTTKNQIMNKIPGLRQKLPVKTDIWGNEITQSDNMAVRAIENSIFPWTKKEVSTSKVDRALLDLYDEIGEASILPDSIDKTFTINKEKYRMTNEEYNKYRNAYGETSYKMINSLVSSKDYKYLNNEEKKKAIENIYSYAKESNKLDYAKQNGLSAEQSTLYKTINAIEKNNGNVADYLSYTAKISGVTKEKNKINILSNADYSNKTKELIYANSIGKDDELYSIMKSTDININEYLKYKTQEFTSDKTDDGTESGKTISGSKKTKVYNYVRNMNITDKQKLLLVGTQYKLTNSERQALAQYVQNLNITNAQKREIYSKLQGFTVYKDGRVTY